jgi:hypothetical protein
MSASYYILRAIAMLCLIISLLGASFSAKEISDSAFRAGVSMSLVCILIGEEPFVKKDKGK